MRTIPVAASLAEARATGATRYIGKQCPKPGHGNVRGTASHTCVECARATEQKRRVANRDELTAAARARYTANPEKRRVQSRARYAANPEKHRAKVRAWTAGSPEHTAAAHARRRASKLQRTVSWSSKAVERLAFWMAKMYTKLSAEKWVVAHVLALQNKNVSGLHVPANFCIIPDPVKPSHCNRILDEQIVEVVPLLHSVEELCNLALDYPELRAGLHKHGGAILELLELRDDLRHLAPRQRAPLQIEASDDVTLQI